MTKRALVGVVVLVGLLAALNGKLMSQGVSYGILGAAKPGGTGATCSSTGCPISALTCARGTCTGASDCFADTRCSAGEETEENEPAGVLAGPAGTVEGIECTPTSIPGYSFQMINLDQSRLVSVNPVDQQLQAASRLLATKSELSRTEAQIKGAIDNYFLSKRVDEATGILTKLVSEAPESPQGKRARVALEALNASNAPPPAADQTSIDKADEAVDEE